MKFVLLLILISFLSCYGCDKEQLAYQSNLDSTKLCVVWHVPFFKDSFPDFFWDPVFSNDYVVFSNVYKMEEGHARKLGVYQKKTGKQPLVWENEPQIVEIDELLKDCQVGGINENTIYLSTSKTLYAYDINTANLLWKYQYAPYVGGLCVTIFGENVLHNYGYQGLSPSWYRIAMFNNESGSKTDFFELNIEDDFKFLIEPSAWTVDVSHDTLLLFVTTGWNFSLVDGQIKAYCYNMNKRKIQWLKKGFTNDNDAYKFKPIILENNRVAFQTIRAVHCFDITTGELLWQHEFLEDASSATPLLYYDNKLILRTQNGFVYCYNPQNGNVLWYNKSINAIPVHMGRMDAYMNKLYFTAVPDGYAYLYCLSLNTGELLWKDIGPGGECTGGLIIDQKTGYLYGHSDWSIICIDLNNSYIKNK